MMNEILRIAGFMGDAFLHIWPYLVITIPLAVAVNMSGASKHIKRAFDAGPVVAIFLATLVGAFSPFCSCGVIPVIAALLISGVPLAPVMSFWIASPSMDLEIFFLSVATIGWNLAIWRLIGTLVLSLGAGLITHFLIKRQWIGPDILRNRRTSSASSTVSLIQNAWRGLTNNVRNLSFFRAVEPVAAPAAACCEAKTIAINEIQPFNPTETPSVQPEQVLNVPEPGSCGCKKEPDFRGRLFKEAGSATLMVVKFMALAFFLEALIILYIPEYLISGIMGQGNSWAIATAALIGVPAYTSNLSALPMIGGLLTQGMSPAAALAFLIAGPTTTLPAMAAVWSLVSKRVFILYVSFALVGAIVLGYVKLLFGQ